MNPSEKLQLVWELWDSLAKNENDIPISDDDRREIEHRLAQYRAGKLETMSWEEVKASILERR
ncbi:MAG: addiction module protein [Bacteroidetes bacterium]|nr:addiction module protein [Bacteroidota bacterium]